MGVLNKASCLHLTCERIVSESFSSFIRPIYSHNTILLVTFLFRTSSTEDNWLRRRLPWTMHNIKMMYSSKQCNLLVMLWLMFNFAHFHAQTKRNNGCSSCSLKFVFPSFKVLIAPRLLETTPLGHVALTYGVFYDQSYNTKSLLSNQS